MLSSKRGRAYAKAIPENRLLLETDAPYVSDPELHTPLIDFYFSQAEEELRRTLACLTDIRGADLAHLAAVINETANSLL